MATQCSSLADHEKFDLSSNTTVVAEALKSWFVKDAVTTVSQKGPCLQYSIYWTQAQMNTVQLTPLLKFISESTELLRKPPDLKFRNGNGRFSFRHSL